MLIWNNKFRNIRLQSISIYLIICIYFHPYYFKVEYALNLYLSIYEVYILSNFQILFYFQSHSIQDNLSLWCYFRKCFSIFSSICLSSALSCLLLQLHLYSCLAVSILNWIVFVFFCFDIRILKIWFIPTFAPQFCSLLWYLLLVNSQMIEVLFHYAQLLCLIWNIKIHFKLYW